MFLVASGNIVITPKDPVPLSGFPDRKGNFDSVSDGLEVNLIAFKQNDRCYLIYSVDTLFVPKDFVDMILKKFGYKYGIAEDQIWLCASHTHFAPALDSAKPGLGHSNAEYCQYVAGQLEVLTQSVLEQSFEEVNIEYAKGEADLNVNRRKRLLRFEGNRPVCKTLMLPNYSGNRDTTLHTFKFTRNDGKLIAILWSYACHPVHAFRRNNVSADYVGGVKKRLRSYFDNSTLTVGFLQGFAGNLKADITAVTKTKYIDQLSYLLQLRPRYTRFPTQEAYENWVNLLYSSVEATIADKSSERLDGTIDTKIERRPLSSFIGDSNEHSIIFRRLDLGKTVSFIGVNAEVVTEYSDLVKQFFPEKAVVGVGYTEDTRIYLPIDSMLAEKGYEVEGFKKLFSIEGSFKSSLNQKVEEAVSALK